MKVLQIAPLWETVPPPAYGGTEAVVHTLVEELVRRGHEVTLCASGDSRTSARLQAVYPRSLRNADDLDSKPVYSWLHSSLSLRDAREYDIIHNHGGEEVMALAHLVPDVPMLSTMHCLITPDTKFIWDRYPGYYNTISWSQRRLMPEISGGTFAGVVYNGIDVASFPFQEEKEEHLLFLGRISPDKGPHLAVEVARRTGRRLLMAGKVDPADFLFFSTVVAPLIDGDRVVFLGEADAHLKRELYRKAYAVLSPIIWDEPFGLVMVEAMACGTPVISFGRGAAPELVRDGETGFIVDTLEEMEAAVKLVGQIDPWACREHVARRFDAAVMAGNYLRQYEAILEGAVRPPVSEPLVALEAAAHVEAEASAEVA
ncbi:MAG TPA: glycosyltransferase family 4 protein [Dehalococcoidia bacterium]|nr:glycosyltransferase family 4 protein [Dehalococcoidia bacterium]